MNAVKTVHKYEVDRGVAKSIFSIPITSRFLSLQVQDNKPVLYFEVNKNLREATQTFLAVETGAEVPLGVRYIGTVMLDGDSYVLHIYWYRKQGLQV